MPGVVFGTYGGAKIRYVRRFIWFIFFEYFGQSGRQDFAQLRTSAPLGLEIERECTRLVFGSLFADIIGFSWSLDAFADCLHILSNVHFHVEP